MTAEIVHGDYLVDGLLHRVNGPAYNYSNTTCWWRHDDDQWCWYSKGYPHRYYGPCDHMGEWWIHNKFIK